MDTRQMRYFIALAETLNFSKAAARMNMTQPPFSRQIAAIEHELGIALVIRNSRHVALTHAGQRFYEDSRKVLIQFDNALRDAQLVASGEKGELRLGFMMHAAHRTVPDIIRQYTKIRPNIDLILTESTPAEIKQKMLEGELDIAITFKAPLPEELINISVLTDQLRLIVPTTHRLARKDIVTASDLKNDDLIVARQSVAPVLHQAILDFFANSQMVPKISFTPKLQHTIVQLVRADLGVALIPASICDDYQNGLVSRPLKDAPALEVVCCVAKTPGNPATNDFVTTMQDHGMFPNIPVS